MHRLSLFASAGLVRSQPAPWHIHAGTVILLLVAWCGGTLLAPLLGAYAFYIFFLAAAVAAASWWGRLPAALALMTGLFFAWSAGGAAKPPSAFALDALRSALYAIAGGFMIVLADANRRAAASALAQARTARAREAAIEGEIRAQRVAEARSRNEHEELQDIAGTLADGVAVSASEERVSRLLGDRRRALQKSEGRSPALQERIEELEALLNLIPVPVYVAHDPECSEVTANRAAAELLAAPARMHGEGEDEPHPYTHRVFQGGRELGPHEMPIQRAAGEGMQTNGEEYEIVFEDGSVKHIFGYASPLFAGDGKIRGSLSAFIDITQRKRAEDALRESEERFRRLADSAPVMIWVAGRDGKYTYFNSTWLEFTGRALDEEIAADPLAVVHRDDRRSLAAALRYHIEHHEKFALEYRMRRHDGEDRWVLNVGSPRYDANGEFVGYIGSCTDISSNKLYEQQLEQADRQKDEFIATLAHELRNPLAPIRNALHILGSDLADASRTRWAREVMERQMNQLVRLVDDLLDVSRITRGRLELRRERVTVDAIVRDAVEASRPLIEARNHALEVTLPGASVYLYADHARATEIIVNLLNNAAKYTPAGGHIAVECKQRGEEVAICVKDNGIGIEPQSLTRIFEMFAQLDTSLDRSHGGLGVGLALARKLAELHGGSLEAASEGRGRGSQFTLVLPALAQPRSANPVSPASRTAH